VAKRSAGLLLFRTVSGAVEVLLVHPGGPFWAKRDDGAWSIPKGELAAGEDPLEAALREFREEMGQSIRGDLMPLGSLRQAGGKDVHAWAVRSDFDPSQLESNTFAMEWPPRSGRQQEFPEIDRAAWFPLEAARVKILKGQVGFLDELIRTLKDKQRSPPIPSQLAAGS
jgi:predicted NUDIX family NTP pyrophosphohydrolase